MRKEVTVLTSELRFRAMEIWSGLDSSFLIMVQFSAKFENGSKQNRACVKPNEGAVLLQLAFNLTLDHCAGLLQLAFNAGWMEK